MRYQVQRRQGDTWVTIRQFSDIGEARALVDKIGYGKARIFIDTSQPESEPPPEVA